LLQTKREEEEVFHFFSLQLPQKSEWAAEGRLKWATEKGSTYMLLRQHVRKTDTAILPISKTQPLSWERQPKKDENQ